MRPFEWGLDWIPPASRNGADPAAGVEHYVQEVMRDTQAFFTPAPTSDFTFTPPDPDQTDGEGGTLRFPSALETPHPENNVVTARWFPSTAAAGIRSAAISFASTRASSGSP